MREAIQSGYVEAWSVPYSLDYRAVTAPGGERLPPCPIVVAEEIATGGLANGRSPT